ncbi:hypothetical protein PV328_001558 [Microctonus aethiopoides]|uniref:Uncharacterized protein n=1 Tax=Microctonus aethiopoides TaxID=144406 RepID=A0AA39FXS5_9HYME|nr:hypothetical protein PV328_001558 [Microctonus aethiopoides]
MHNNSNTLSETYDDDDMKRTSVKKWNYEKDMQHNVTDVDNKFNKTEKCTCNEIKRCNENCICGREEKSETKINHQPFLSTIDDINTSLQKSAYDIKISRPLSKSIQLETELYCQPCDNMAGHQLIANTNNSYECKESCSAVNNEESDDVTYIYEEENNTGSIIEAPDQCSSILLTDQEGLVEIHILSVQFSPLFENTFFNKIDNDIERLLCISCKFYGEEPISSSMIKYPELKFNSSFIYRVSDLDKFFSNITDNPVDLQLHIVIYGNVSYVIAHGQIDVTDILTYPQNKIHYIVNMKSLVPCVHKKNIGQLSLWIRLSCDIDRVKSFKEQNLIEKIDAISAIDSDNTDEKLSINSKSGNNESMQLIVETIHERKHKKPFNKSTDDYVSNSSDALENHQEVQYEKPSIISETNTKSSSAELSEDTWEQPTNLVKEIDNSIQNTNLVAQKNDNSNNQEQTSFNNNIDDSKDTIIIKIHRLKLIQGCSLLHHPDIHRLFVEFSFLGKSGFEYETESVPIPKSHTQNMYFKYQIKICINEKRNLNERNYLDGILCGEKNPNVQFNIVSEPLAEEMETKECIDVGGIRKSCGPHGPKPHSVPAFHYEDAKE